MWLFDQWQHNSMFRWALAFAVVCLYNMVRAFLVIVKVWNRLTQDRTFRRAVHANNPGIPVILIRVVFSNPQFLVNFVLMWVGAIGWSVLFQASQHGR